MGAPSIVLRARLRQATFTPFPIGTFSTSSQLDVSTGFGRSIIAGNQGIVIVFGTIQGFQIGGASRITISVYRSILGIPPAGNPPAAGDISIGRVYEDPSTGNLVAAIPLAAQDSGLNPNTTYFYYLTLKTVIPPSSVITGELVTIVAT